MGTAGPMIAQKAVMEIICKVGGDVRGDAGRKIPRHLRATGRRSRHTEFIPGKSTAYVDLVRSVSLHFIVTVSGVEVPLGSEIMVQSNHAKVIIPNNRHVGFKFLHVQMVTTAQAAARCFIGGWHECPQSLHGWADSQTQGIACASRIGHGHTCHRHRPGGGVGVEVIGCRCANNGTGRAVKTLRSIGAGFIPRRAQTEEALLHLGGRDCLCNRDGIGESESFVICKDIGLAAKNTLGD